MYCQKCGNQMPDNARFCSKCGTQTGVHAAPIQTASAAPRKEKKAVPAKAIGVAAVAVVVILAAVLIIPMLGGGSTLDLKQAYTVSMQGVEGYGAVRLTENEEYLTNWLCESIGLDRKGWIWMSWIRSAPWAITAFPTAWMWRDIPKRCSARP